MKMIVKNVSPHSIYVLLLQIIGLAVGYFLTGKLSNLLAIPPGYASLIFPASGVALAGVLLYGNQVFWGILLGSFLFNMTIPVVASDFSASLNSELISLAIAAGSGIQAIVGAYLVRRFAGFPNEFANEKSVLLFLFYGGVVSALVNATLSISLLVTTGRMPIDVFLVNWLTWWGGDALGIIIFAPLGVICMSPHHSAFQDRKMAATLPVLIMFFLTVAAVFYEVKSSNERVKIEFENHAESMNTALKSSLTTHLNVLQSLKSLYAASEIVNPAEFKTFVTQLLTDFQGIQALGWNRRVLASERDTFEKSVQKGGYPNFQITERDTDKKLVRAGNRPEYYPVHVIEPYKGNESAMGYDVYSNEIRHEAINRAIDTDGLALTAKIVLVQEKGKQNGFLAFIPVYRRNSPHQTLEERRDTLLGLVTAVFRGGDIIAAALKNQNLAGLSYRLIDENASVIEQLIFASDEREFVPFVFQQKGIFGDQKTLIHSTVIPIGGRMWRFEIVPTPTYFVEHRATNVWFIFLGGIVLTILTILVALVSSGRQRRLQKLLDNTDAMNYELRLKSAENESWAAELVISNKDLAIANEELLFQSMETEKRATELTRSYDENAVLIDQMNHMQKLESTIASLFFAKDSFGIPASESAKNHATSFIACGSPDSSFVQSLISHKAAA